MFARGDELAGLLERIARGDGAALSALYDATSPWVHGIAFRIVRETFAAEEVVLDVYLQVWRKAGDYSRLRGSPEAWLIAIARSRAVDRLRVLAKDRKREEPSGASLDRAADGADPAQPVVDAERRTFIERALGSLPADQRRSIELAFFQGLTHMKIAEELGEPLGTIKTRIRLGMSKLRELLGPAEEYR
jgi:RNA polymerase sigma-70 factor (ECF subfamily)